MSGGDSSSPTGTFRLVRPVPLVPEPRTGAPLAHQSPTLAHEEPSGPAPQGKGWVRPN